MAEKVGVVLLLVGKHIEMDLDSSCCLSYSGVEPDDNSADIILDRLHGKHQ